MFFERKKDSDLKMEISPLIDVVFLLLIFFMVTTTFIDQVGLDLKLPESSTSLEEREEQNVIWVDREGKIFLNEEEVLMEDLHRELKKLLDASEVKEIVIKADERGTYGRVFRVIEEARKSGARGITAIGERKEE